MRVEFTYRPLPSHEAFHRSTSYERMMFGAFGSGKTYAIIAETIAWCLEQPGIRGCVMRRTVPELRDTTEPIFRELLPPELWRAGKESRSGGHMERFTFPNGSVVLFRSCDDANKHRSLNLGFIAYDEANEIDEESFLLMASRIRQRDITAEARAAGYSHEITRRGIWGATNPSGKDWLWRRFHPDSRSHNPKSEMFTSTTLSNPFLPPEYVESLLAMPEAWVKRYVLCDFDDFNGSIYEDWGYDTHVIKHPEPEDGRIHWMSLDPGTENPTAGLWVWFDQEQRRLVGIADYQQAGLAADAHAASWRVIEATERMNVRWRVGDPNAITQRDRGTAISLQTQYAKLGYQFTLGASNERDRITALGRLIHLKRFVVSERCERTYEAIKQYQWKDLTPAQRANGEDPKERPLKKDSHLVECAQFLAGRNVLPPTRAGQRRPQTFQEEIHAAIGRQTRRSHQRPVRNELGTLL